MNVKDYVELLTSRAKKYPDKLAYTFLKYGEIEQDKYSYKELDRKVRSFAAYLQILNTQNERILLFLESDLDYVVAFLSCLYSKSIAVTLHPPKTKAQFLRTHQIIQDSEPKYIITTSKILETLGDEVINDDLYLRNMEWITLDKLVDDLSECWQKPNIEPDTLAFLQYTSGSTSDPKGVMVSHRNLLYQGAYMEKAFSLTSQDIACTWLPHFHDMGLILGILQPIYTMYPAYLMLPKAFLKSPLRWLKAISKYKATFTIAPNFAYDLCCDVYKKEKCIDLELSNIECMANGAEPVRKKTMERFAQQFADFGFNYNTFYPCYGMAETTLMISGGAREAPPVTKKIRAISFESGKIEPPQKEERTLDIVGCGTVHLDTQIKIISPKTNEPCDYFEVGEIYLKGEIITQGYFKNKKATQEKFNLTIDNEDSFFQTGDLGFLDETGELYITGRAKDLIIINGRNHAPQDIELTVQESHSAIQKDYVAAFTIEKNDLEVLIVVAGINRKFPKSLTLNSESVFAEVSKSIAKQHDIQMHDILLVRRSQIPKTTSGKIQRGLCKKMYFKHIQKKNEGKTTLVSC